MKGWPHSLQGGDSGTQKSAGTSPRLRQRAVICVIFFSEKEAVASLLIYVVGYIAGRTGRTSLSSGLAMRCLFCLIVLS